MVVFRLKTGGTHILFYFKFMYRVSIIELNSTSSRMSTFWYTTVGLVTRICMVNCWQPLNKQYFHNAVCCLVRHANALVIGKSKSPGHRR